MKDKVGETAGRIWEILKDGREVTISQLPKLLNENSAVVHQSLGWLARKDKIEYRKDGRRTFVSLNGEELSKL